MSKSDYERLKKIVSLWDALRRQYPEFCVNSEQAAEQRKIY